MDLKQLLALKDIAQEIAAILCYVITIASIIVKLTPTLKDDNFLLPIVKFVSKYIALNRCTKDDLKRSNML